uniref:Uncharacterized protein n=1 Tax=Alexandrium andersonii TaxID=327968 RepID=A0A7S2FKP2_9DINO
MPKLPNFLFTSLPEAAVLSKQPAQDRGTEKEDDDDDDDDEEDKKSRGSGDWTPVEDQESRMDRRTFFHTDGKVHTFHNQQPVKSSKPVPIGEQLALAVEDIHFGNPRIKVMSKDPEAMPQMLKWERSKFAQHCLQCAQVSFGASYRVWCAVGIRSNRLLYAMKRQGVELAAAEVVEAPAIAKTDEDADPTYGNSIQGIQLVP